MHVNLKYYKELDGFRAIAALIVMYFHFCQIFEKVDTISPIMVKLSKYGMGY